MRVLLAILLISILPLTTSAKENSGVGYPTVAAALETFKARSDVKIYNQDGWTIVDEFATNVRWSFTPPNHPAYPAVVIRTLVKTDSGISLDMRLMCEASQSACDKLRADFDDINKKMRQSMERQGENVSSLPESEIQIERLGDDAFRLILKSVRSHTVESGLRELLPKSQELCGAKIFRFEHTEYKKTENISRPEEPRQLELKQELSCVDATNTPARTVTTQDREWQPTAAQVQQVERLSAQYFAAKDGRKYDDAYAMLSPSLKSELSRDRWEADAKKFNEDAGEVRSRIIKKLTWYKDSPKAPPGVYAAVDFVSQYAHLDTHCGYLVWHEQADGTFLLSREEQRYLINSAKEKLRPNELEQGRERLRCS